jgi:hypothetical protein
MSEAKHRRILKLPKWVMRVFFRNALGFCIPKKSAISITALCVLGEVATILLYLTSPNPAFSVFITIVIILVSALSIILISLAVFGVIVVRKDCFNCQFSFHILEHEKSHLKLNSLDEITVEEETLKQTYGKLIPLLLSKPKMCKGCYFTWRRMYSEATSKFIKENQQRENER